LVLTNRFDILERIITTNNQIEVKEFTANRLRQFSLICKLSKGKAIELKEIIEIDFILSQLNPLDSHIPKILGQVLKSSYYLRNNELTRAYDCLKSSIELSNLAGYRIIEVKLLKTLSNVLLKLGENAKSSECNSFALQLIEKTGFQYDQI